MAKQGLYANINKRKRAGTSRPKSKSTITPKAYANMKKGFPKKVRQRKELMDPIFKTDNIEEVSPSIAKTLIWHIA